MYCLLPTVKTMKKMKDAVFNDVKELCFFVKQMKIYLTVHSVHRQTNVFKFLFMLCSVMFVNFLPHFLTVVTTQFKGDKVKLTITLNKLEVSFGLNTVGNIWGNASTQLYKI